MNQHYRMALGELGGKGATGGAAGSMNPSLGSGTTAPAPGGASSGGGGIQAQNAALGLGGAFFDALGGPVAGIFGATGLQDLVERGALIIFGGVLIIVGLLMLVKDTSAAKAVGDVGMLVATDGTASTARGAVRQNARAAIKDRKAASSAASTS